MSILNKLRESVNTIKDSVANTVKNRGNNTSTVDTSYGANTSSGNSESGNTQSSWWSKLFGNYNGMTYGDYFKNLFNKSSEKSTKSESSISSVTPENSAAEDTSQPVQSGTADNLSNSASLPQNTQTSASQQTAEMPSAAEETTPTAPVTSAWNGVDAIDSYEEYLRKQENTYKDIYDEQTKYYDEQNQKTLDAIEEQRQAALAEAENQKKLLYEAAETTKNSAYTNAEQQLMADLNYSQEQYDKLIESINAQKTSGEALAKEQRELLLSMSESQRNTVLAAAEEQYNADIQYATNQYQSVIDAINKQKATGEAMAAEQRDLLLSMSKEMQEKVYEAAELQRQQAYTNADVERERSVVDARSSYEQNKASYGANAEAMAGMGLTGSGYGDYINSQAYAQQRAETQQANAQAAAVKRDADYAEGQSKLEADTDYLQNKHTAESQYAERMYDLDLSYQQNKLSADQTLEDSKYAAESNRRQTETDAETAHGENVYNAESQYADRIYDIDTTYATNKANADTQKSAMDYEAKTNERNSKYEADQAYTENKYAADTSYSENIANAEASARADNLAANQTADAGKFNADMSYRENILNNDNTIGAYRQQKEEEETAKAEEETSYARAAYTEFLSGANSGSYTAEQLQQLAKEYGLSEEQATSLINAANAYEQKRQAAANAELSANAGDNIGYIEDAVESGAISEEQGQAQIKNIQESNYNGYAEDITYGYADTDAIDKAYSNGEISQAQYDDLKAKWNNAIDTNASTFYNTEGTALLTKSAAKTELDKICNSKWCSEETKNALRAVYNSLYTPITKNVSFNNDGSFLFFGSDDLAEAGNNFSVICNGTKYRIESGGEVTDTNVKEVASDLSDGTVFGYQGTIYIKKDSRIFKIQKRANSYTEHYNSLYNIFFGSGDTTSTASANAAGEAAKTKTTTTTSSAQTTVTYPSDSEIAAKASAGTLTYHDVAKYNAGIRTASEFARGNNSDSKTYGTYQAYLKAMYEKYAPKSSTASANVSSSTSSSVSSSSSGATSGATASKNNSSASSNTKPAKWTSYKQAADAGYSNIMTQTEWARRKSGCSTYQEYLDKMYAKYVG